MKQHMLQCIDSSLRILALTLHQAKKNISIESHPDEEGLIQAKLKAQ